jgi:aldose 1-epimerase
MKCVKIFSSIILSSLVCISCSTKSEYKIQGNSLSMAAKTKKFFGIMPGGAEVYEYLLANKNGIEIRVINYGGIITSLKAPDRNGILEDIVLGYDSLSGYLKATPYFGAIVGRYANRIANGKFSIDGKEYSVAQNNNGQHLHGGEKGFDKVFWDIEQLDNQSVALTYQSKDMEEGYPGNLSIKIIYTLSDSNEMKIEYSATTDKKTIVNLTQHSYFNLTGNVKRDILDHEVVVYSDKFVPVNKVLIPTGQLKAVSGTPFDFRTATAVGLRTNEKDEQLVIAGGYDHCWVLSSPDSVKHAATVYEPASGRAVDVYTTEPGMQLYCGNFLDGSITGKRDVIYKHRYGFCLETEHFPDSPNQKSFPSTELNPGEVYRSQTTYVFSTR